MFSPNIARVHKCPFMDVTQQLSQDCDYDVNLNIHTKTFIRTRGV